jgi:hypothetical protein
MEERRMLVSKTRTLYLSTTHELQKGMRCARLGFFAGFAIKEDDGADAGQECETRWEEKALVLDSSQGLWSKRRMA